MVALRDDIMAVIIVTQASHLWDQADCDDIDKTYASGRLNSQLL